MFTRTVIYGLHMALLFSILAFVFIKSFPKRRKDEKGKSGAKDNSNHTHEIKKWGEGDKDKNNTGISGHCSQTTKPSL